MSRISDFPITRRWQPKNPDVIQLYSLPTPNGIKISAALEETGLPYEAHLVSFATNDQMTPEFLSLNPNNKIPAILDPDGPDGTPIGLFESGAILIYLAEKSGMLMPEDPVGRYETIQWLMFQMAGVGPMFGQFGHFYKFAADKVANNPYPTERYSNETRRLLGVLEQRLAERRFIMGDVYTIADIAIFPWVRGLTSAYDAAEHLGLAEFANVNLWLGRCLDRPASQKALNIPPRD
ncbi:glutathione S-transferase C-terminal domain-containing protein [Martelella sp. HB161492]|uniref:glutathione S-transferase C-terminal domain-containing protein n=1 Tax=Martelella sp. HB161492 TaxID=2720726 RepID=UPI00158FF3CC|nr:glutathione S-transferase C-terminal domain-containing protein [Martelella sp. HB161492]